MIHVLQKNKCSYLNIGSYDHENYIVNGCKKLQICPGNSQWGMVSCIVKTLQRIIPPGNILEKYVLKEEYVNSDKCNLPKELPSNTFEVDYDDDGDRTVISKEYGAFYDCYNPKYISGELSYANVEFVIIDKDCEPVELPPYVKVKFPDSLIHHPETWHKYPCYISAVDLFNLIYPELKNVCEVNSERLNMSDYKNIGILEISIKIQLPKSLQKKVSYSYYPTIRSKKPKTAYKTPTSISYNFLRIVRDHKEYKDGSLLVGEISADNYEELKQKINKYIKDLVSLIDIPLMTICEYCKGLGLITNKHED